MEASAQAFALLVILVRAIVAKAADFHDVVLLVLPNPPVALQQHVPDGTILRRPILNEPPRLAQVKSDPVYAQFDDVFAVHQDQDRDQEDGRLYGPGTVAVAVDGDLTDLVQQLQLRGSWAARGGGGGGGVRGLSLEPGELLGAELPAVVVTKVLRPVPVQSVPPSADKHEHEAQESRPSYVRSGVRSSSSSQAQNPIGGFGVGSSRGGQGAGHGSWVLT